MSTIPHIAPPTERTAHPRRAFHRVTLALLLLCAPGATRANGPVQEDATTAPVPEDVAPPVELEPIDPTLDLDDGQLVAGAGSPTALSLEEALAIALGVSERVGVADALVERARGQRIQAISGFLPQIFGTVAYQRTFVSQFDRLRPQTPASARAPDEEEGELPVDEAPEGEDTDEGGLEGLPFGRDNVWTVGVTISQSLYAGGANRAQLIIARGTARAARLELTSARAQTVLETAQAYFDAQLAARRVAIAEGGEAQARRVVEEARLRFEVGTSPELDVLQARVALRNLEVTTIRERFASERALLRLRQLLDLPAAAPVLLTTGFDDPVSPERADAARALAGAPDPANDPARVPVLQADAAVEQAEGALKAARAQGMPTVSLTADLSVVAYPQHIWPPVDPDQWLPNATLGLALQVPIFQGLLVRGRIISARADLTRALIEREQTAELAALDALDALGELEAALAQVRATEGATEEALRTYDVTALQVQEGLTSINDLADVRYQVQQALANRAQAARDLAVARIRLALLPALPLSTGLSPGAVSIAGTGPVTTTTSPTITTPGAPLAPGAGSGLATGLPSTFPGARP